MNNKSRRWLALLMSVMMLIGNMPVTALADTLTMWSDPEPFAAGAQTRATEETTVNPGGTVTIKVGDTVTLQGSRGNNHSWGNLPQGLERVSGGDSAGTLVVKGVAVGSYSVTHKYNYWGQRTESFTIKVEPKPVVASIEVTPDSLSLWAGDISGLTATITKLEDAQTEPPAVTWTSNDSTVATVDENGQVTAIGAGSTEVTATVEGHFATVTVNVKAEVILDMTNVGGDRVTMTIEKPTTVGELTAGLGNYTWTSGGAPISPDAVITGNTKPLVAWEPSVAQDLLVSPSVLNLSGRETQLITATVVPDDAVDKTVLWESQNPTIATVDHEGNVTAVSAGTTKVTATVGNITKEVTVNVTMPSVSDTTDVYVFVRIELDSGVPTDGWTLNKDKWYTIGKISVPSSLLPPLNNYNFGDEVYIQHLVYPYLPSIELHSLNENVAKGIRLNDPNAVDWKYLKVENGTSGSYSEDGKCWHLDGYLKVSAKQSTLTIKYQYNDGTKAADDYVVTVPNGTNVAAVTSPAAGRDGYSPDQAVVGPIVVTGDRTIVVTYYPNNHTVSYRWTGLTNSTLYDADGMVVRPTLPETRQYTTGTRYTVDMTYTKGMTLYVRDAYGNVNGSYTFSGWDQSGTQIMPNNNVVIRGAWSYNEVTVPSYTVTYLVDNVQYGSVESYKNNQPVTVQDIPTKEGYTFNGWSTDDGVTTTPGDTFRITKNVTYRGIFVPNAVDYTVEYYYDGAKDDSKTEQLNATYGDVINTYPDKNITGYKFDHDEGKPLTITEVAENNVIRVYYVKDSFGYTVEYYYDGTKDDSKTEHLNATYGDVINTYPDKNITGYKFDHDEGKPLTITEEAANNVIKVYYVKDSFGYTVEYYYDGTKDDSKTEHLNATYGDVINTYPDKNITGYKFDHDEGKPLTITEEAANNVIKVYYVKDNFEYSVEYYYDGTKDDSKTEQLNATYGDVINTYPDKNITGYKFDHDEGKPLTITEVAENNVIRVYYVKDSFGYKVEYYYDGAIDDSKTEQLNATFGDVIDTYPDKNITGYKFDHDEGTPLTITEVAENNVIRVYYVKDSFEYTVEYYYDGEINPEETETLTATYGDEISEYEDKVITGYRLEKTEKLPLTISEKAEENVIKVYYVKRTDLSYVVNYYWNGDKTQPMESKQFTGLTFQEEVTELPIEIEGYTPVSDEAQSITIEESDNVINFYYRKNVELVGNEAQVVYNGTEQSVTGYTGQPDGVVFEGITAVASGINVTTEENKYLTVFSEGAEGTVDTTDSYIVTKTTPAELIITQRPVTIIVNTAEYDYDAEAKTVTDAEGKEYQFAQSTGPDQGLVGSDKETLKVVYGTDEADSKTLVGEYVAAVQGGADGVRISNENGDVTANYAVSVVPGLLTIKDNVADQGGVVTKTHENKEYELGETVTFEIKVTNIYDEAKTITVTEQEGVTIAGDAVIENVAPGAQATWTATYVITEADILRGSFTNHVTATFLDGKTFEDEDEVDVVDRNPHLTVTKAVTNTPVNVAGYVLGETIQYSIIVTNDGNVTVENIEVRDLLSNNAGNVIGTIPSLAPGESSTAFPFEYQVQGEDLPTGNVHNVATAQGTAADPEQTEVTAEPGETDSPVLNELTLTVNYWYDRVGGAVAARTVTGVYTYGQAYNVVSPRLAGYTADIGTASGIMLANTVIDVIYSQNVYTVTVQYRYIDEGGNVAAPDNVRTGMRYGDEYRIESPTIAGWTPSQAVVRGVMPEGNVLVTVFYRRAADTSFVEIDEYGVPLGLGSVVMNVGDCIE